MEIKIKLRTKLIEMFNEWSKIEFVEKTNDWD